VSGVPLGFRPITRGGARRPIKAFAVALALILTVGARADEPTFDCTKASSRAEEAVCGSAALASLDREVNRLHSRVLDGPDMTPERATVFRAGQRDWVRRRHDCSNLDLGLKECVARSDALRIAALRRDHADARRAQGPSDGPYRYVCEGLDSPVSVTFINSEAPMVVLSWGDNDAALGRARSGSGARYHGEVHGEPTTFWTRGSDEALFTPPGGTQLTCKRDSIG